MRHVSGACASTKENSGRQLSLILHGRGRRGIRNLAHEPDLADSLALAGVPLAAGPAGRGVISVRGIARLPGGNTLALTIGRDLVAKSGCGIGRSLAGQTSTANLVLIARAVSSGTPRV